MYMSVEDVQRMTERILKLEDELLFLKKAVLEAQVRSGEDPLLLSKALAKLEFEE